MVYHNFSKQYHTPPPSSIKSAHQNIQKNIRPSNTLNHKPKHFHTTIAKKRGGAQTKLSMMKKRACSERRQLLSTQFLADKHSHTHTYLSTVKMPASMEAWYMRTKCWMDGWMKWFETDVDAETETETMVVCAEIWACDTSKEINYNFSCSW